MASPLGPYTWSPSLAPVHQPSNTYPLRTAVPKRQYCWVPYVNVTLASSPVPSLAPKFEPTRTPPLGFTVRMYFEVSACCTTWIRYGMVPASTAQMFMSHSRRTPVSLGVQETVIRADTPEGRVNLTPNPGTVFPLYEKVMPVTHSGTSAKRHLSPTPTIVLVPHVCPEGIVTVFSAVGAGIGAAPGPRMTRAKGWPPLGEVLLIL